MVRTARCGPPSIVNTSRPPSHEAPTFLVAPLPAALHELLAAYVVAAEALLGELALDDVLGGDAGVVDAGEPEGGVAAHPVPADQGVLHGGGESVAQVQFTGHVGGRHDDAERLLFGVYPGREVAPVQPELVQRPLSRGGVVSLGGLPLRARRHQRSFTQRAP